MKRIIMSFCLLAAASSVLGQGYYGQRMDREQMRKSLFTQSNSMHILSLSYDYIRDKDNEYSIAGGIYSLDYTYILGGSMKRNDGFLRGSYTGGELEVDDKTSELNYRVDLEGAYRIKDQGFLYGSLGYGIIGSDEGKGPVQEIAIGFRILNPDGSFNAIVLDYGSFEEGGNTHDFYGIEINAFQLEEHTWLKWFLGRVNGENFVRTDLLFPLMTDDLHAGFLLLARYVTVNSHSVSAGTEPLSAYSGVFGPFTKHDEWWLYIVYGIDRRKSNWSLSAGYGYYRAKNLPGTNNSAMAEIKLTFYF